MSTPKTRHKKNRSGGLGQLRVTNKSVPVYSVPEAGERCHVYVLDLYFNKIPPGAIAKHNFYLTLLSAVPSNSEKPWYTLMPVGRSELTRFTLGTAL